jgi:hypothetical protein
MRFITADTLEGIESIKALSEEDRATVLVDAERVRKYVQRHPWIEEEELRRYGERNDLPPDRLNAALAFAIEAGQLVGIGPTPDVDDAD